MTWPSSKIGWRNPSSDLLAVSFRGRYNNSRLDGIACLPISQRIEASMMQTAAEEGALFIEVFLGPSAQELATSRTLSPESIKKLDDLLEGKLGERMRLIKIWLPDATLAYSTNKETIGGKFPSPPIAEAFEGKVSGEFDYLDEPDNATERRVELPLVEIHAPLFRAGTKEIIAVGEVYNDGRRLAADLASIRGYPSASSAPLPLR